MTKQTLQSDLAQRVQRELSLLRPTRLTPEAVNWGSGPNPEKVWIPENETPLFGADEFARLTDEQRRRYNQYYALQKTEAFLWFERFLVIAPLVGLMRSNSYSPEMKLLIESFIADEEQHSASLGKLLVTSRPDLYQDTEFYFFKPSGKFRAVASLMASLPRLLSSWVLFLGVIEEQTIMTAQRYRQGGEKIDAVFSQVHQLHAQDEARHCKLDSIIAEWLISEQVWWQQKLNALALTLAFRTFFDSSWGCDKPIQKLVEDFPDLAKVRSKLVESAKEAWSPEEFGRKIMDRDVAPITSENSRKFGMLADAIHGLFAGRAPAIRQRQDISESESP